MISKVQILETPKIFTKEYRKFKTEDIILQELIDSFTTILENNIKIDNLKLFYNNIGTLKVENKSVILNLILDILKDNTTTG